MSKGLFSQSMCLLTDGRTTLSDLAAALRHQDFNIVKESEPGQSWQFGGAALVVEYRADANGYVAIDLVNEPWPDEMGDPDADVTTFGAWSMGHFGPWTFPGGLARARQQAWSLPPALVDEAHVGFVRLRLSYGFGANQDAPVLAADYDPLDELRFLSRLVLATAKAAGVLLYFNPNGEVLRDPDGFSRVWEACAADDLIPLSLWMNSRLFQLTDRLTMMDTVGNSQLDRVDIEAIFPTGEHDPADVDYYLRNVSLYLLHSDPRFETGEAIDGPGETNLSWQIEVAENGLSSPPRKVLRLYPKRNAREVSDAVAELTGAGT